MSKNNDIKNELKELFTACFLNETKEYIEYFFDNVFDEDNAVFTRVSDKVASAFFLVYKQIELSGHKFCLPFVTAASTLPEYRGQGLMGGMLNSAFNRLYSEGIPLVTLGTYDRHSFYGKFGLTTYVYFTERELISGNTPCKIVELVSTDKKISSALAEIYSGFMRDKNGFIVRDERYYDQWQKEIFADGGKLYLFFSEPNKPCGYIYVDKGEIVELILPDGVQVPSELVGKKYKVFTQSGNLFNMLRIINPIEVLNKITYADTSAVINIKITDSIIKENNQTIRLCVSGGKGQAEAVEGEADAEIDISVLTALVVGLKPDAPMSVQKLFNKQINAVFDRY